jgi:hypothetical protein
MKPNRSYNIIPLILAGFLLVSSCKKENNTPVLLITPTALRQTANPEDVVIYNLSVTSNTRLSFFRIYLQPQNSFEVLIHDSSLVTKNFSWKYQYLVPKETAGKLLTFRFNVIDENGTETNVLRQIQVGDVSLVLSTGLEFFSRPNVSNNAFDLENLVQTTAAISDSSLRDLQEYTADTTLQSPVHYWFSPAGGKFVKANTFDFGNASLVSAKNAFESSIQKDVSDSLEINDIYITRIGGISPASYAVIKITGIVDQPGITQDKFVFDVKK